MFNISTGKATKEETARFLLDIFPIGKTQMEEFMDCCAKSGKHFDKPLKKNKLKNFATEDRQEKARKPSQLSESKHDRDIMGEKKLELKYILAFPLTSAPPALSHCDGTGLFNTEKDGFTNLLLTTTAAGSEQNTDTFLIEIIDGFYFLGLQRNPPNRFGRFAEYILRSLCSTNALERYIIFEKYDGHSIRGHEESKKKHLYDDETAFEIKGPNQECPSNFKKNLNKDNFKTALVEFLINYWAENENITNEILGDKRLFVTFGKHCYLFCAELEKKKCLPRFTNNHIDIDTQIIMHIQKASQQHHILIKVQNIDSIIVSLLYHMQFWGECEGLVVETGDITNKRRINMTRVFSPLTVDVIQALPSWFVFCGNKSQVFTENA